MVASVPWEGHLSSFGMVLYGARIDYLTHINVCALHHKYCTETNAQTDAETAAAVLFLAPLGAHLRTSSNVGLPLAFEIISLT